MCLHVVYSYLWRGFARIWFESGWVAELEERVCIVTVVGYDAIDVSRRLACDFGIVPCQPWHLQTGRSLNLELWSLTHIYHSAHRRTTTKSNTMQQYISSLLIVPHPISPCRHLLWILCTWYVLSAGGHDVSLHAFIVGPLDSAISLCNIISPLQFIRPNFSYSKLLYCSGNDIAARTMT